MSIHSLGTTAGNDKTRMSAMTVNGWMTLITVDKVHASRAIIVGMKITMNTDG